MDKLRLKRLEIEVGSLIKKFEDDELEVLVDQLDLSRSKDHDLIDIEIKTIGRR
jgi:hypothetical protein